MTSDRLHKIKLEWYTTKIVNHFYSIQRQRFSYCSANNYFLNNASELFKK